MKLITPDEAGKLILEHTQLLETTSIRFDQALGRILREDLVADRPFPPFDRVTMDGIAFRSQDLEKQALGIQGLHAAGDPKPPELLDGHCWQVMTGSIMPADCDTVVPYEEVEISEEHAEIRGEAKVGQFIHREGSDAARGKLMVPAGSRINPAQLGMMASIGATEIKVTRLPKITILTTGDELIPVDQTPLPHQLRQSNGPTLVAALKNWGPTDTIWNHLPDDLESTTEGIASALESSDLLILSGGISKGKKDYVRPALESLIGAPRFHGVAQRPGKPLAFWGGDKNVIALPGNPNSTLTAFQRYVVPLLLKMTGASLPTEVAFPLASPIHQHPKLTLFLPAQVNAEGKAISLSPQNSGDFVTPLKAEGYLEIPPGEGVVSTARYF